jgi:hypothetical protein
MVGEDLPDQSRELCVLGMPRGGTTMAATLLKEAGVFMGDNLPVTIEDPQFAKLLSQQTPDKAAFRALVEARRAQHARWGFKAPFRHHWDLLAGIENVRYLAVFRDVLAVANRNKISADASLLQSMQANLTLQQKIVEFILGSDRPMLLLSYEKALTFPKETAEAICKFIGAAPMASLLTNLTKVIQPNEIRYVASQDPLMVQTRIHVDLIRGNRIAGWARRSDGTAASLQIEVNGKPAVRTRSILPRPDLAQKFGGDGRLAFDITLPSEFALISNTDITIKSAHDGLVLFRKTID